MAIKQSVIASQGYREQGGVHQNKWKRGNQGKGNSNDFEDWQPEAHQPESEFFSSPSDRLQEEVETLKVVADSGYLNPAGDDPPSAVQICKVLCETSWMSAASAICT